MTGTWIMLLRGINVNPSTRLAMSELRDVVSEAGHSSVRTVLQSGNVILESAAKPDAPTLEAAILARSGVRSRVLLLTADRFRDIVAGYPFLDVATDESKALITFVERMPAATAVTRPSDAELAPERLSLGADAVYQWLPDGVLKTKLPPKFVRQFGENATARNLRTARRIAALSLVE